MGTNEYHKIQARYGEYLFLRWCFMQTAIVIIIVAAAGFYLIRRFYNSVAKGSPSTCGCGCDGCGPVEKNNCTEIKNQIQ